MASNLEMAIEAFFKKLPPRFEIVFDPLRFQKIIRFTDGHSFAEHMIDVEMLEDSNDVMILLYDICKDLFVRVAQTTARNTFDQHVGVKSSSTTPIVFKDTPIYPTVTLSDKSTIHKAKPKIDFDTDNPSAIKYDF